MVDVHTTPDNVDVLISGSRFAGVLCEVFVFTLGFSSTGSTVSSELLLKTDCNVIKEKSWPG